MCSSRGALRRDAVMMLSGPGDLFGGSFNDSPRPVWLGATDGEVE